MIRRLASLLSVSAVMFAVALSVVLFEPRAALAACKGGAPDGKCEPPDDDCSCDDCLAACSGECTPSTPPECTLEDACTCSECWTDPTCTQADKSNCDDDGDCDFFLEGCCCADCAALSNCAAFDGDCGAGGGGGGSGGGTSSGSGTSSGGGGASGGSGGASGGSGGAGGVAVQPGGCGCTAAGASADPAIGGGLCAVAAALAALGRRRRRCRTAARRD